MNTMDPEYSQSAGYDHAADYPTSRPERPRATSALSHGSRRSRRSSDSKSKLELTESPKDKKKLHTKADPNQSINEAQPGEQASQVIAPKIPKVAPRPKVNQRPKITQKSRISKTPRVHKSTRTETRIAPQKFMTTDMMRTTAQIAANEETNLENLRSMTHKDADGNLISDPDNSNPTRPRLERPLDTIRSFQRAADGTDARRFSQHYSPGPGNPIRVSPKKRGLNVVPGSSAGGFNGGESRRSSYYGSPNSYGPQSRRTASGGGGYYGRQNSYGFGGQAYGPNSFRPDSFAEDGPPVQYPQRHSPGGMPYDQNGGMGRDLQHQGNSFETVNSGSEAYAGTTNPSSVNSSNDRIQATMGMSNGSGYGPGYGPGFTNGNGAAAYGYGNQSAPMQNGGYPQGPVSPPRAAPNNPRQRIQLGGPSIPAAMATDERYNSDEFSPKSGKRRSFLARAFSKNKK